MKTTNYEISKKLKEAGFEAEFNFHYKATDHCNLYDSGYEDYKNRNTPAYDLETILDALPVYIIKEYKDKRNGEFKKYATQLTITKYAHNSYIIEYRCFDIVTKLEDLNNYYNRNFSLFTENESIADTAGRMWLELKKKNLL